MGRVQLVKSIIHGMHFYSFHIYMWPRHLLHQLDSSINNFIWSGDIGTRKVCTVSWAGLLRKRFIKNGTPHQHFFQSSVWGGIKEHMGTIT